MTITTIILDDNPQELAYMQNLLEGIADLELVESFSSPIKAEEWLQKNQVDLIITDIEMEHMSGLELISNLKNPPLVIFASTYPKYAAESFKLNPIHYLVKPISDVDLRIAVERVNEKLSNKPSDEFIIIKSGHSEFNKVKLADILFIEADNDYVKVICSEQEYRTHCTLKEVQSRLPAEKFIKTHRSYLVNIKNLSSITGSSLQIQDFTIPLSRAYKQEVHDIMGS